MFQGLLKRFGVPGSVVLVTAGAIVLCVTLVVIFAQVFREPLSGFALAYAVGVPLVLYPPLAFIALNHLNQFAVASKALELISNTDPLTTTFNRQRFLELGTSAFALAQRHHEALSLVFFDIDNFQALNATYGRTSGDHVLRALAELCKQRIRKSDVFARLENEEFVCLLPRTPSAGALNFAERLRQTVAAATVQVDKQTIQFTISAGVKTLTNESNLEALLNGAEQAMRQAKAQGRNRTVAG